LIDERFDDGMEVLHERSRQRAIERGDHGNVVYFEQQLRRIYQKNMQSSDIHRKEEARSLLEQLESSSKELFKQRENRANEKGNSAANQYLEPDRRPKDKPQIITCKPNEDSSYTFFDDNIYEWNTGVDFSSDCITVSQDWARRESIVPEGFRLRKSLPLRSIRSWKPLTGYPPLILMNAKKASKNKDVQKAVAFIDMFLYSSIMGRLPKAAVMKLMGWPTIQRIFNEKMDCGEWEQVALSTRFRDLKTGKMSGDAAVYAITPKYLLQCLESDMSSNRYPSIAALGSRKRYNPDRREIEYTENIPDDVCEFLGMGTGLRASPNFLLHMLLEPGYYRSENYSTVEVWEKALHGWNTLSPYFHGQLVTSWSMGKNDWLYDKKPALQQLSKMVRMTGLEGSNGESIREVDFSGCQLNIARVMAGEKPQSDPYHEIALDLENLGISLSRSATKKHTLAIMGGRNLSDYKHLLLYGQETDPVSHYLAVLSVLEKHEYPIGDIRVRQTQGKIMMEVMRRIAYETGHTGLSVFDAILLPSSQIEIGKRAMREASEAVLGIELPFKSPPAAR
jgi:hypothetical protein